MEKETDTGVTPPATDRERKEWWIEHARQWLMDPRTDRGLLYSASQGLAITHPALAAQCFTEYRKRKGK